MVANKRFEMMREVITDSSARMKIDQPAENPQSGKFSSLFQAGSKSSLSYLAPALHLTGSRVIYLWFAEM